MPYDSQPVEGEVLLPGEQAKRPDGKTLSEKLQAFVGALHVEAKRRRDRRASVERRWIKALRQYHGIYEPEILEELTKDQRSKVFLNYTAVKTDNLVSRIVDLLFPTDEANWSIEPTPVPSLTDEATKAIELAAKARQTADAQAQAMQAAQKAGDQETAQAREQDMRMAEGVENELRAAADKLHATLGEARGRAKLMEAEIRDQLEECDYAGEARRVIEDAARIGSGVVKGPIRNHRPRLRWSSGADGSYALEAANSTKPGVYWVDPWCFFPDPDARRVEDSEGFYELHMKTRTQLRAMARDPEVNKDALRELLKSQPSGSEAPAYIADLQRINGHDTGTLRDRYMVWEYTGPVACDELKLLAEALWSDRKDAEGRPLDHSWMDDIDPLKELTVRVVFCQDQVLSFALHPLDSEEPLYRVYNIREDEGSLWGFGMPHIVEHPQAVLNSAMRMMMDNAGLGTGPQLLVNREVITPENGSWRMTPRKTWWLNTTALASNVPPFQTFSIDTHQDELTGIISLALQMFDEISGLPKIAEGEQGTGVTKTAQGMALLMNSANVSFRRMIKNWDDHITRPVIRSMYDFNMQFTEKPEIKGDYEVSARGASVLLVREMQAQNLMIIAATFGEHPSFGPMIRKNDLLRALFRAHAIPADEVLYSETEVEENQAKQAANAPQDPAIMIAQLTHEAKMQEIEFLREKLQSDSEIENLKSDTQKMIARLTYEGRMQEVAENMNAKREALEVDVAKEQMAHDSKERITAAEVAIAERTGKHAGGNV